MLFRSSPVTHAIRCATRLDSLFHCLAQALSLRLSEPVTMAAAIGCHCANRRLNYFWILAGTRIPCSKKHCRKETKMKIEDRLKEMGIALPPAVTPVANYVPAVRTGNLVFLSGHGPFKEDGSLITGKVGSDLTAEQGYEAARRVAIGLLGSLKAIIGDLDKVRRVVKLLGLVNCKPDFTDQPKIINGASDFLVEVFGDKGKHARSAVGTNALPVNIAVEIEMIVEVEA